MSVVRQGTKRLDSHLKIWLDDKPLYLAGFLSVAISAAFPYYYYYKNSSGDEIANVLVNDDIAHT